MLTTLSTDMTTRVPRELAQQFGLGAGSQLDWMPGGDDGVIIVTVRQPSRKELLQRVRAIGARDRHSGEDSVADLIAERGVDEGLRNQSLQ